MDILQAVETPVPEERKDEDHAFSIHLLKVMDQLAYGPGLVKCRREAHRQKDANMNVLLEGYSQITCGSKGEGLTSYYESDHDIMFVDKHNVCVLSEGSVKSYPDDITVYLLNSKRCHPGHFRLISLRKGTYRDEKTETILLSNKEGNVYVSREAYSKKLSGLFFGDSDRQLSTGKETGPSIPATRGLYSEDRVWAFRCTEQRQMLASWVNTPREYGWPSQELIEEVVSREAQIVPVGCKGSEFEELEWRVCFIPGEQVLTDSLNEVQYKLYILLKMITKDILKPLSNTISSYVMKNVVFWIVESNPMSMFADGNLIHLLKISLGFLLRAVLVGNLPYYMIPERNLLIGRLGKADKEVLTRILESLLQGEPSSYLLQCKKLRDAMKIMSPNELQMYGEKKEKVERLRLEHIKLRNSFFQKNVSTLELERACWSSREFRKNCFDIMDVVFPEWHKYITTDKDKVDNVPFTEQERVLLQDGTKRNASERTADHILANPEMCRNEMNFEPDNTEKETLVKVSLITIVRVEVLLS